LWSGGSGRSGSPDTAAVRVAGTWARGRLHIEGSVPFGPRTVALCAGRGEARVVYGHGDPVVRVPYA